MESTIGWDEWRIVEAIARSGTTSGAAALLGLSQSTVFRRVSQLEEELGVRLFDRDKRGFRLTPQGEAILPEIRRLQGLATDIERRVTGLDERQAGDVRLSVNATVVRYMLADSLAAFRRKHPRITVHLNVTDRVVDIKAREADLVIRGSNDPDPDLFGRKLMRLHYAIYRAREATSLPSAKIILADPGKFDWILLQGDLRITAPGQWMRSHLAGVEPVLTADEVETTAYLIASGLGIGLLPRFLGDRHPGLVRVGGDIEGLHTELWVLTHEDLRKTARVATLLRFLASVVQQSEESPEP